MIDKWEREPERESKQECERKPDAIPEKESAHSRERLEQFGNPRLRQQLDFILEIDKEKKIGRQTYLSDGEHKENDAEHAWHMAIMAILLAEYANEPIDVLRTVLMLLIHDIVEIDAGDTYAYDEEGKKTQNAREQRAAERIYGLLPADQGKMLYDVWQEFEEQKTPEARFARTLDNLQPMMLNAATDGKAWVEHGVHIDQILGRNRNTHLGSEELWDYAKENWLQPNLESGHILGGDVEEKSEAI
ncbi:MAG: HD domain-containing protein [Clostridiales bacterium]|nr:HD domain-containing protein [Clostridiales bacterium]